LNLLLIVVPKIFRPCEKSPFESPFEKSKLVPSQSPFAKSLWSFGGRAHAPRCHRPRHRAASGVAGWPTRPPPPSALARPLRGAESHVEPPGCHAPPEQRIYYGTYIKHRILQRPASVACPFVIHTLFCNKSFVTYHTQRISKNIVNCDATATLEKISGVKAGSAISLAAGATRAPIGPPLAAIRSCTTAC
jgi:hypothetical protein